MDQGRARVLGEPRLSQLRRPMARAAVLGRLTWQVGTVAEVREETATARTIVIDVPGWPGHAAGQHVDVRLTAEDGYSAQRSYSIASAPGRGRLELTVQRLEDGEVSPYLTDVLRARLPAGTARPDRRLVRLGPGGPGPGAAGRRGQRHGPADVDDPRPGRGRQPRPVPAGVLGPQPGGRALPGRAGRAQPGRERARGRATSTPAAPRRARGCGSAGSTRRCSPAARGWTPEAAPAVFICGPTGFVEAAASLLVKAGHDPGVIKTERFGPSGGQP